MAARHSAQENILKRSRKKMLKSFPRYTESLLCTRWRSQNALQQATLSLTKRTHLLYAWNCTAKLKTSCLTCREEAGRVAQKKTIVNRTNDGGWGGEAGLQEHTRGHRCCTHTPYTERTQRALRTNTSHLCRYGNKTTQPPITLPEC